MLFKEHLASMLMQSYTTMRNFCLGQKLYLLPIAWRSTNISSSKITMEKNVEKNEACNLKLIPFCPPDVIAFPVANSDK